MCGLPFNAGPFYPEEEEEEKDENSCKEASNDEEEDIIHRFVAMDTLGDNDDVIYDDDEKPWEVILPSNPLSHNEVEDDNDNQTPIFFDESEDWEAEMI